MSESCSFNADGLFPGEMVIYNDCGRVVARKKGSGPWVIEPDGVNVIDCGTEFFDHDKDDPVEVIPPRTGTYRVLLERIGD